MSDSILNVHQLGKSYRIRHQAAERYTALRDVVTQSASAWGRRLLGRGRAPAMTEETFWALKDVSFDLQEGDRLGIIGPNGAGKTTLLKLLSRITEPTTGRIVMKGRAASLLEVGTGFHPELTGRENIFLNGALLGMGPAEIRKKFDEIVAFSEVEKFLDTPVKRYSSGMYVRLAFAVAAHLEPEILMVDEVLAVGDAAFQKKCLGKMNELGQGSRTVLFISHNMSFIQRLCNKCLLLDKGTVRRFGPVQDVVTHYLANQTSQRSVVSLTRDHNPYDPEQRIQLDSLELVNGVQGAFTISWDEPMVFKLTGHATQKISNLSFGMSVETMDFVPVLTVRSTDRDKPLLHFEAGQSFTVQITIQHPLRAGLYQLSLGIAAGDAVYEFRPQVAQLEILGVGKKPYLERNFGLVHCDANWEWML